MEKKVEDAVRVPLMNEGITLVGVHVGVEDGEKTLFVTIDHEEGVVDVNLCVKATKIVSPIIDTLDLEISDYVLDVGSKGVSENGQ